MKMIRNKILPVVLLLFIFIFLFSLKSDGSFNSVLKKNRISLEGVQNFKLEEGDSENIIGVKENEVIRLKIIKDIGNKEKAKEYTDGQLSLISAQYEPQPVPYPEFITNSKDCAEKFKPVKKEHIFGNYELLFAGERFSYGACSDDLIKYKASLGYFYCKRTKTLHKLEYFIPKEESIEKLENLTGSFNCI